MNPQPSVSGQEDPVFNSILAEYFEGLTGGRAPERATFIARHPRYAVQLEQFFADQARFAALAAPFMPPGSNKPPRQSSADLDPTIDKANAADRDPILHDPPDPLPGEFVRYFGD